MLSRLTVPLFITLGLVAAALTFTTGATLFDAFFEADSNSSPIPTALAAIRFGASRAGPAIVNPLAPRVYAAQEDVPAIAFIDTDTNTISTTLPTEGYHTGIAFEETKNLLYVSQEFAKSVRVIDVTAPRVVQDLPVPGGSPIGAIAINPNNYRLYVIQNDIQTVAILDSTSNGALLGTLPVDAHFGDITVNPITNRLYITSPLKNELTVVDSATDTILATLATGRNPKVIAVNPATNRIYVTIADEDMLAVLDGTTNAFITHIPVGKTPISLAVDPYENRIYVGNLNSKDITVIDGRSNTVIGNLGLGVQPGKMTFHPESRRIYIASDDGKAVFVLQTSPSVPLKDQILVSSDENVRVLDGANGTPPDGWNQTTFDDGGWQSAAPTQCTADAWRKPFTHALWLGHPTCSISSQVALFRKTFTLPTNSYQGVLRVHADDKTEIYLNGERIGATDTWKHEYLFDLRPHLRAGTNVLAIRLVNEGGSGGVLFQANLGRRQGQ